MRKGEKTAELKAATEDGIPVLAICGGYQMLGECITDPYGVEEGGMLRGMELLPMETEMEQEKTRTQVEGQFERLPDVLSVLSGMKLTGYEIHMGRTVLSKGTVPLVYMEEEGEQRQDGAQSDHVYRSE